MDIFGLLMDENKVRLILYIIRPRELVIIVVHILGLWLIYLRNLCLMFYKYV